MTRLNALVLVRVFACNWVTAKAPRLAHLIIRPKSRFVGRVTNAILLFAALALAVTASLHADNLLDVAFTGASVTSKTGFAATGLTADDFWNTCTFQWEYIGLFRVGFGALSDLKFTDGSTSATVLSAGYFYNAFANGASDPMY